MNNRNGISKEVSFSEVLFEIIWKIAPKFIIWFAKLQAFNYNFKSLKILSHSVAQFKIYLILFFSNSEKSFALE